MSTKEPKKEKLSLSEVKKIPKLKLLNMIQKAKDHLKKDDVWKRICKENKESVDIIDLIPTMFGDLDVSAKTERGVVIINYKLLCDGDFYKDYSYLIHEYTHWFQQCYGDKPTQSSNAGDYLDNPYEIEGFSNQVNYIADNFGEDEAEEYVDDLLDYHDVDSKKEKKEKKETLMSKV